MILPKGTPGCPMVMAALPVIPLAEDHTLWSIIRTVQPRVRVRADLLCRDQEGGGAVSKRPSPPTKPRMCLHAGFFNYQTFIFY